MQNYKIELEHEHDRWFKRGDVFWVNLEGNRLFYGVIDGTAAIVKRKPSITASLKEGIRNKNIKRMSSAEVKGIIFSNTQSLFEFNLTPTDMKKAMPKEMAKRNLIKMIPVEVICDVISESFKAYRPKKSAVPYGHSFYEHLRFEHYGGISTRNIALAMQDLREAWEQHPLSVKFQNAVLKDIYVEIEGPMVINIFNLTRENILGELAENDLQKYKDIKEVLCWFAWMGKALAHYLTEIRIVTKQRTI